MKILNYHCESYKAFREKTLVQMRPLTLFFGKNNSGKSTLLRLPRLIVHALSGRVRGSFPVKVDELLFGGRFRDLIHGGLAHGSASFGIKVEDNGEMIDLSATVQNVQNMSSVVGEPKEFCVISQFRIDDPEVFLNWEPRSKIIASYKGIGELPFQGLWPEIGRNNPDAPRWSFIKEWKDSFQTLEEQLSHLGPIRDDIPRLFEDSGLPPLGLGGLGAVFRLGQNRDLLDQVSSWFKQNMDGWHIWQIEDPDSIEETGR